MALLTTEYAQHILAWWWLDPRNVDWTRVDRKALLRIALVLLAYSLLVLAFGSWTYVLVVAFLASLAYITLPRKTSTTT